MPRNERQPETGINGHGHGNGSNEPETATGSRARLEPLIWQIWQPADGHGNGRKLPGNGSNRQTGIGNLQTAGNGSNEPIRLPSAGNLQTAETGTIPARAVDLAVAGCRCRF